MFDFRFFFSSFFPFWTFLEPWLDDLVGLQSGDHDVERPEEDEERGGDGLDGLWPAQLAAADALAPPDE